MVSLIDVQSVVLRERHQVGLPPRFGETRSVRLDLVDIARYPGAGVHRDDAIYQSGVPCLRWMVAEAFPEQGPVYRQFRSHPHGGRRNHNELADFLGCQLP